MYQIIIYIVSSAATESNTIF